MCIFIFYVHLIVLRTRWYSFLYESAVHNSKALSSKSSDCENVGAISSCCKGELTVLYIIFAVHSFHVLCCRELFHGQRWHNCYEAPMTLSTTSSIHIFLGDFVTYVHSTLGTVLGKVLKLFQEVCEFIFIVHNVQWYYNRRKIQQYF